MSHCKGEYSAQRDDQAPRERKAAVTTFFQQECPVCGRHLRVRIEYLGRQIACRHCGHRMIAADSPSPSSRRDASVHAALQRANQWLAGTAYARVE